MNKNQNGKEVVKELLYTINYIYYGVYFFLFASLQVFHVFLVQSDSSYSLGGQSIYALYALIEVFVEVFALAVISSWILKHKWKKLHFFYVLFTVLLLICRSVDLLLVRLMDISVWHGMGFIFQETPANFIEMLYATNVPIAVWFLGLASVSAMVVSSLVFFLFSEKISKKFRFTLSGKGVFGVFILSVSVLVLNDVFIRMQEDSKSLTKYSKALPWKKTLFSSAPNLFTVGGYLKPLPHNYLSESAFLENMDSNLFRLARKPDLFLFVVESLREDFLTEEVTPNLVSFKNENFFFPKTLSAANATHISWFSIFYSLYPFYWTKYQDPKWNHGSYCLSLLKKMGYKLHVYSSSRLSFYSMDRILLGKDGCLADSIDGFQGEEMIPPHEADSKAIEKLCRDIHASEEKGGRVFVVFLDSTHFDYSWPEEENTLFTPVEGRINYVKLAYARDNLAEIKNRYRNSLSHVDRLFASFRESLIEKGLWEDSVVAFTADHGEEFNEQGQMFHASNLSIPQLQVPLYLKLGNEKDLFYVNTEKKASQMDIFPSFFHYLLGDNLAESGVSSLFQGESLFKENPKSYVLGARYNASRAPYQFYVQGEVYRMTLEFCNPNDIFNCNTLKVSSIVDENHEEVPYRIGFIQEHFGDCLHELFGSP